LVHHSADFQNKLGRDDLPKGKVIGESWELVDRPENQSVTLSGSSQRELIEANPEQVMGDRNNAGFFGNLGTWEVFRGALYRVYVKLIWVGFLVAVPLFGSALSLTCELSFTHKLRMREVSGKKASSQQSSLYASYAVPWGGAKRTAFIATTRRYKLMGKDQPARRPSGCRKLVIFRC
jgi:hypothetical protein